MRANTPSPELLEKYQQIWAQLKQHRKISIACNKYKQGKLVKAIINIKHREGNGQKAADLPMPGKLHITRGENTITLELIEDLRQITVREL